MSELNKYFPTDSHYLILKLLITEGISYYSDITHLAYKNQKMSNSTVSEGIKRLHKCKLIEENKREKIGRGRPKIYYIPTVHGLIVGLIKYPELWDTIDKVAEKNKDVIPLIFGKWSYFKDNKVLEIVKSRFKESVSYYLKSITGESMVLTLQTEFLNNLNNKMLQELGYSIDELQEIEKENINYDDPGTYLVHSVFGFNYLYIISPNEEIIGLDKQNMLIKVIKNDEDLKNLFYRMINDEIELSETKIEILNEWKENINNKRYLNNS